MRRSNLGGSSIRFFTYKIFSGKTWNLGTSKFPVDLCQFWLFCVDSIYKKTTFYFEAFKIKHPGIFFPVKVLFIFNFLSSIKKCLKWKYFNSTREWKLCSFTKCSLFKQFETCSETKMLISLVLPVQTVQINRSELVARNNQ